MRPFVIRKGRFIPNQAKFPLSTVSECVIQEESAGKRGRHICGLATRQVTAACRETAYPQEEGLGPLAFSAGATGW
jgi:hypothetical protein